MFLQQKSITSFTKSKNSVKQGRQSATILFGGQKELLRVLKLLKTKWNRVLGICTILISNCYFEAIFIFMFAEQVLSLLSSYIKYFGFELDIGNKTPKHYFKYYILLGNPILLNKIRLWVCYSPATLAGLAKHHTLPTNAVIYFYNG